MRREEAIRALRAYLAAVRRDFGVRRIALFGSTVRGDAREDSDLDILVDFETGPTFLSFMGLKCFLEDRLGRKVDLVAPDALKPRLRRVVEREAVDVAWQRARLAALRGRHRRGLRQDPAFHRRNGLRRL